jgi:hypothetical protein
MTYELISNDDQAHQLAVQERIAVMHTSAQARAQAFDKSLSWAQVAQMGKHMQSAPKPTQKLYWMRQVSDAVVAAAHMASSPCKALCNHCCHIAVAVSSVEAKAIADVTGMRMNEPATVDLMAAFEQGHVNAFEQNETQYFGQACPFLKDGQCSIYEYRPMSCRWLISMADDDLLCRLVDGGKIPVPYLDTTRFKAMSLYATGTEMADIRQWFGPSIALEVTDHGK